MLNRALSVVFVAVAAVFAGCASMPDMTAVALTPDNGQTRRGYWEGRWAADNGSGGVFELDIAEVGGDGRVSADRMYVTRKYGARMRDTRGQIEDEKLHLDLDKGNKNWIEMELFREDQSGELWLRGRYSVQGGDSVFLGRVFAKKTSSN
jgi:hypothetical protein